MNQSIRCPGCNRVIGMMYDTQFVYSRGDVLRPSLPCSMRCRCGADLVVLEAGEAVYSGASAHSRNGVRALAEQPSGVRK